MHPQINHSARGRRKPRTRHQTAIHIFAAFLKQLSEIHQLQLYPCGLSLIYNILYIIENIKFAICNDTCRKTVIRGAIFLTVKSFHNITSTNSKDENFLFDSRIHHGFYHRIHSVEWNIPIKQFKCYHFFNFRRISDNKTIKCYGLGTKIGYRTVKSK